MFVLDTITLKSDWQLRVTNHDDWCFTRVERDLPTFLDGQEEDCRVKSFKAYHRIHKVVDDGRTSPASIKNRAQENLAAAFEIEQLALSKNPPIKIIEPFQGVAGNLKGGRLLVLGPDENYYRELLAKFDFMPALKLSSLVEQILGTTSRAVRALVETWNTETLLDPTDDDTSSENLSSLILLVTVNNQHYLLTGDAGVPSIVKALDFAATQGIEWSKLQFLQVPHHGSKHNLGPTILNRLLGPPTQEPTGRISAFISAAKQGSPKHPNKRVINALIRRQAKVFVTVGQNIRFHDDAPQRGWVSLTPLPFSSTLDDDET